MTRIRAEGRPGRPDAAGAVRRRLGDLGRLAEAAEGSSHIVLLGAGGSTLAADVFGRTYIPIPGFPELVVLDGALPGAVRRVEKGIDPATAIFVVIGDGDWDVETSSLFAYFHDRSKNTEADPAGHFLAVADPGSPLETIARGGRFREVFPNPPGPDSALSFSGMLPAALMGLDVGVILDRADAMIAASGPEADVSANPGARLAAALAGAASLGRNKLTIVASPPIEALGPWIGRVVAENLGGGIVAVADEPLGAPSVYGPDRLFVQIRTADSKDEKAEAALRLLADAGHPVITHVLADTLDLGAEFVRWEIATELAAALLGFDPIDRSEMAERADLALSLLLEFEETGRFPEPETIAEHDGIALLADEANRKALLAHAGPRSGKAGVVSALRAHFSRARPGDFVSIARYYDEGPIRDRLLDVTRRQIRDTLRVATTSGRSPLSNGLGLLLTADDDGDLPIPGRSFGFAALVRARALGDFRSISTRGGRSLRVHLGDDADRGLTRLSEAVQEAIGARRSV